MNRRHDADVQCMLLEPCCNSHLSKTSRSHVNKLLCLQLWDALLAIKAKT